MTSLPLHQAARYADRIIASIIPYCAQVEVAGSIRRARPLVNDIDLVALPRPGEEEALRARCRQSASVLSDGPHITSVRLSNGLQVDVFYAAPPRKYLFDSTPGTWGTVLLCRTGSKEHNVMLCQKALSLGLKWKTTIGLCKMVPGTDDVQEVVAAETEEEIFTALGLAWVPPALREILA